VENGIRDNYRFILSAGALHSRSVSKTVSIPKDLGRRCDWRTCHSRHGANATLFRSYPSFLSNKIEHMFPLSK
jgi:hypothetical protein